MESITHPVVDTDTRCAIRGTRDLSIPIVRDPHFILDRNLVVRAGAGSGKTSALIERMVALVRAGEPVHSLAAITFTLKAAGEMRARFFEALSAAAGRLRAHVAEERDSEMAALFESELRFVQAALHGIDDLFIDTIHAFCSTLLRERPFEAGLTPDFSLADDQDEQRLRIRFWNRYLGTHLGDGSAWRDRFADLGIDPGSLSGFFGVRCRFQDLDLATGPVERPNLLQPVSAALDYLDQLLPSLPEADTNADGTLAALRKADRLRRIAPPATDAARIRLLELFDATVSSDGVSLRHIVLKRWGAARATAQSLKKNEGDGALADLVRMHVRPAVRAWRRYRYESIRAFVEPAVAEFSRYRKLEGRQTFDDLLMSAAELLREHPSVRLHFRSRYRRLLVDEFQDTDPVQAEVLFLLTADDAEERSWMRCSPVSGALFIVGDDKQSIYRFRRADVQVYERCVDIISNTGGRVLDLVTNFRSDARICTWVNRQLAPVFSEESPPRQAPYEDLRPHRPAGEHEAAVVQMHVERVDRHLPGLIARLDAAAVSRSIACLIDSSSLETDHGPLELSSRLRFGDCMVLLRTSLEVAHYARALDARGIPYSVAGGKTLGGERILAALNDLLRAALDPHDEVRLAAVLRGPLCAASDVDLLKHVTSDGAFRASRYVDESSRADLPDAIRDGLALVHRTRTAIRTRTPSEGVGELLYDAGLLASAAIGTDGATAAGALLRIHALVRDWNGLGQSWPEVIHELERLESGAFQRDGMTPESGGDAVRIMMVHQAKGLQARVVFLAMPAARTRGVHSINSHVDRTSNPPVVVLPVADRGSMIAEPPLWDDSAAEALRFDEAEEIRLAYVAATRAEDLLVVSRYPPKDGGPWAPLYRGIDVPVVEHGPEVTLPPEPSPFDLLRESVAQSARSLEETARSTYWRGHPSGSDAADPYEWPQEGLGKGFGIAVHRLLESAVLRRDMPADPDADRAAARSLVEQECASLRSSERSDRMTRAGIVLEAFRRSAHWSAFGSADLVRTEVPFANPESRDGQMGVMAGVIDLAYRIDGVWYIVDYKTDLHPDTATMAKYEEQLAAYRHHWHAATGEPVADAVLWFADTGPVSGVAEDSSGGEATGSQLKLF